VADARSHNNDSMVDVVSESHSYYIQRLAVVK